MISKQTVPSLVFRIYIDAEGHIGHGKIRLLEMIAACGSISGAARKMNMQYKQAWTLIEEIRNTCRREVISGHTGGDKGGGTELTPFGHALVKRYRNVEQSVNSAIQSDLLALQADLENSA